MQKINVNLLETVVNKVEKFIRETSGKVAMFYFEPQVNQVCLECPETGQTGVGEIDSHSWETFLSVNPHLQRRQFGAANTVPSHYLCYDIEKKEVYVGSFAFAGII